MISQNRKDELRRRMTENARKYLYARWLWEAALASMMIDPSVTDEECAWLRDRCRLEVEVSPWETNGRP